MSNLKTEYVFLVTLILLVTWTIVNMPLTRVYQRTRFNKTIDRIIRTSTFVGAGAGLLWLIVTSCSQKTKPFAAVLWLVALVGFGMGALLPDHNGTSTTVMIARIFTVVAVAALGIQYKIKQGKTTKK